MPCVSTPRCLTNDDCSDKQEGDDIGDLLAGPHPTQRVQLGHLSVHLGVFGAEPVVAFRADRPEGDGVAAEGP